MKWKNPLGKTIFERSYAFKNDKGEVTETFEEACNRVAEFGSKTEEQKREIAKLLKEQKIVPGGRWWYAAGRKIPQIANCFVLPTSGGLGKFCHDLCVTLMTGGGVGVNYSDIEHPKPRSVSSYPVYPEIFISRNHPDYQFLAQKYSTFVKELPIENDSEISIGYPVKDSRKGWGVALLKMAEGMLDGKEVVLNLSSVRPRGASIKSFGGVASGPESLILMIDGIFNVIMRSYLKKRTLGPIDWMKIANFIGRGVSAGGNRRGAQMAMLHWKHKSIDKFITCKDVDGDLEGMNISVVIDNTFVKQAGNRGTKANKLYDKIIRHACRHGEPGLWNIELARKNVPDVVSTNPCLTEDSLISTSDGFKQVKDLKETPFIASINGELYEASNFFPMGIKSVYRIETDKGHELKATRNHKIFTAKISYNKKLKYKWKELKNIKIGDLLVLDTKHQNFSSVQNNYERKYNKEKFTTKVLSISYAGKEPVFDCVVNKKHAFVANGVIVHNCGEQSLEAYGNCNLGHINLAAHKTQEELFHSAKYLTEMLINGTLKCDFPLPEFHAKVDKNRRIGVGILGLHTWLVERGKRFKIDKEDEKLFKDLYKHVRSHADKYAKKLRINRPETVTTVAPTGSVSFVAGVTSGIEPMFCAAYKRRYYTGGINQRLAEKIIIDPLAKKCLDKGIKVDDSFSLTTDQHLDVQIKIQRFFVDNATSKTINLPKVGTFDIDEVKESVLTALKKKIKGVTLYPDGARGNQPIEPMDLQKALEQESSIEQTETECSTGMCDI